MSDSDLREGQPGPPPDSPIEHLPTHQAAASNDVARLAQLVDKGSPLVGSETSETPLHAAAKRGAVATLSWLLDNQTVSPLEKAGNGNTAAHYAAVYGHLEALKLLIEHDAGLSSQVVSQLDESGLSLVSLATLQGDKEMTAWLLENYPEVGDTPNTNGDLAVHFAAAQGHLSILKLLVRQYGKEAVEKQDKNMTKPVYFASQEGRLTVLDYLINELGADPVAREKSGISSVHAAVQAGRYKAVKWLISKLGPKYILDKTIDGATPLHMAAAQGHTDILRYLLENLENKNDVNALDHIHATPAHDAAEYGQMESMLLLLKNGADISIKDTEDKTPYELAMEQNHQNVAAMIADLRDNGPLTLTKYERKKHRSSSQPASQLTRTTRHEAEELSVVIKESSDFKEQRRTQHLQRQESLQRMNERGLEDKGRAAMSDEDEIEHTLGPNGDIYAKPKKRKHRNKGRPQGSDEDILDDSTSFPVGKTKNSLFDSMLPLDDTAYASANHETTSNYSRPSRVRRYQDSDSEITSISSQYRNGRHNIPGFYPPYGPALGGGFYPPMAPPPRRGHHSSASSLHSSRTGHSRRRHGYPQPTMQYTPYGYYPMPYPGYAYPYPHYGAGYRPKTTEERMQLAAIQQSQAAAAGHMMYYYNQPRRGRRSKLKKKTRSRQPSRDPSPPGLPRRHMDIDMGYGPAVQSKEETPVVGGAKAAKGGASQSQTGFHPQAPPITGTDGSAQAGESLVNFDSNFIMMKKSDTADEIKQLGGTTLNTARAPRHYDGRWDSYIMTDSESEREVDENYCVAFAAETAAILAIGCVSGLKGIKKLRKGPEGTQQDRPYLSSAWDEPPMPTKAHSRRGSISGMADPSLKDVSPADFAAREEMGDQGGWASGEKRTKKKKNKKATRGDDELYRSASAEALDKQPQSELLAGEIERQKNASVSRSFGQKMLFNALGARESSMLDIATTSLAGSVNPSADEAEEDDEFNETINMVHGIRTEERVSSAKKAKADTTRLKSKRDTENGERPKSARKKNEKQKAKEEEKTRKEREREEKKQEKMNSKRERQRKKEEEKKAKQEAKDKGRDTSVSSGASPAKRPVTPKKKSSPTVPVRSAPPPPKSAKSTATSREATPNKKSTSSMTPSKEPLRQMSAKSSSPPSQRRRNAPSSAASQHNRQREMQKPTATSTPLNTESSSLKRNRAEKAQLRPSPMQPTRSTDRSKQTSQEPVKVKKSSALQKVPTGSREGQTNGVATQRKNKYFDDESDEEEEFVGSFQTKTDPKPAKPEPKEEVDPGIADLDAVLAQLEDIQTGGLMSWLEPNKVTDVDQGAESEESEDSLPLIVPTTKPSSASARKKTPPSPPMTHGGLQSKPAGPQSRSAGPQSKPADPQFRPSIEQGLAFSRISTDTGRERGLTATDTGREKGLDFSSEKRLRPDEIGGDTLADLTSLQRTKHGSPHPLRRKRGAKEGYGTEQAKATQDEDQTPSQKESDGGGQRSAFEQNVMATLQALMESMNQLKGNPSITQTEITEQTQIQQQLIENLITYSQHDPKLVTKLLSLLNPSDKASQDGMEASSSHQLEELQQRILGAHEKTHQETQEHFKTQEALQRAIQRTLEEQAQQQMKGMEANFQMFSKLMEEQLSEQRKKFEEELKKRRENEGEEEGEEEEEDREAKEKRKKKKNKDRSKRKDKKKKRKRHGSDSESVSSRSEDEGMMVAGKTLDMPTVKTMEAKIFTQDLLQEDTTPPKQSKGRMRRPSDVELFRTTEALSRNFPPEEPSEVLDEEEDEEMYFQHARPVTIRRADIKVQRQDKQHVEVNERGKPIEEVHPLSGAGGELAAALKLRQRQITNRERK